jgi:hypothetical protein
MENRLSETIHPAQLPSEKLLENCRVERTRRGGPGGQHRNKVESAIVITHQPTGISGQAGERRSQFENRKVAIERLRLNLAVGYRVSRSLEEQPSELWKSRARGGQIGVSPDHSDFPALLAEALDCVAMADFDMPTAASCLGVSGSQLVKLFKLFKPALAHVNSEREQRMLGPLK